VALSSRDLTAHELYADKQGADYEGHLGLPVWRIFILEQPLDCLVVGLQSETVIIPDRLPLAPFRLFIHCANGDDGMPNGHITLSELQHDPLPKGVVLEKR
jgi:hypothetical protein